MISFSLTSNKTLALLLTPSSNALHIEVYTELTMDMRKLIGHNVATIRRTQGLTQEEFSKRSGFSQQYISGLERGYRNPTLISVQGFAKALGVSHLDLLRPYRERAKRKKVTRSRRS